MKHQLTILLFCLLGIIPAWADDNETGAVKTQTITILTYNVRNCKGMDGVADYERVAAVIRRIKPDIVALQELDSATVRSKKIIVLGELARLTGMIPAYRSSIDFQGGGYGIGILTREKPAGTLAIALPGQEESRSLLVVELKDYVLACTHLSLTQADRLRSIDLINSATAKFAKPVFLAGDLNAKPDSPEIQALTKQWQFLNDVSEYTIPADQPNECIDYILAQDNPKYQFRVSKRAVEKEPVASDHLPVWVKVKVQPVVNK